MFDVVYYEKNDKTRPAEEYILSEDVKMQAKIFKTIDLLAEYGNQLTMPFSKYIDDGILELRIKQGNDISRIFYFFIIGQKAILTNGFRKKTDKTPDKELALAKKYKEDYMNKNKGKE